MPHVVWERGIMTLLQCKPHGDTLWCVCQFVGNQTFAHGLHTWLDLRLSRKHFNRLDQHQDAFFTKPWCIPGHSIDEIKKLGPAIQGYFWLDQDRGLQNSLVREQFSDDMVSPLLRLQISYAPLFVF